MKCVGTVQEAGKKLCANLIRALYCVHVCIGNGGSQLPTLQSSDHTMIDSTHRASDQTSVTHSASKVGPISGVIYCSLSFRCLFPRSVSSSISESQSRHGTVITVTYVARSTFVKMELVVLFDYTCLELRP